MILALCPQRKVVEARVDAVIFVPASTAHIATVIATEVAGIRPNALLLIGSLAGVTSNRLKLVRDHIVRRHPDKAPEIAPAIGGLAAPVVAKAGLGQELPGPALRGVTERSGPLVKIHARMVADLIIRTAVGIIVEKVQGEGVTISKLKGTTGIKGRPGAPVGDLVGKISAEHTDGRRKVSLGCPDGGSSHPVGIDLVGRSNNTNAQPF